jgi:hypothetical protein
MELYSSKVNVYDMSSHVVFSNIFVLNKLSLFNIFENMKRVSLY